jgi:FlaA1/EpsC-like NDP-sugar epimerase
MTEIDTLSRTLTRRARPLVDPADPALAHVRERVRESRVLVIGGAGSIGGTVVTALAAMRPTALTVVDLDENGLADLVRELRSGSFDLPARFSTSAVDFGGPALRQILLRDGPFDAILNLAAMKHVRSERDAVTLQRMIDTNVRAVAELCEVAGETRVFSVSSDKAVKPHSLMGATKRWMEKVVVAAGGTSARFANVAFSKGSLPRAILQRLERGEPVAAPDNVSRYFITHEEAADICLLAAFEAGDREFIVPRLDAAAHAVSMVEVATEVLKARGLAPRLCASEAEAKDAMKSRPADAGWWPCLFEPADTGGEKDMEELLYATEGADERYRGVTVVTPEPQDTDWVAKSLAAFRAASGAAKWDKAALVDAIATAVPELQHSGIEASLDQKM